MIVAPIPVDEPQRLAALRSYFLLDTDPESELDGIVQLASYVCQTPIAAISLVDGDRQWFKAITGLDARQTSRDVAFCAHTILQNDPLVVNDALSDERFCDNPLVASAPHIRFYAGIPLVSPEGFSLGSLCVIDRVPRTLSPEQINALRILVDNVMAHFNLRRASEHRIQLILDTAMDAVISLDGDRLITSWNRQAESIFGYPKSVAVGRDLIDLIAPQHRRDTYQREFKGKLDPGGRQVVGKRIEIEAKRVDDQEFPAEFSITVIPGEKEVFVSTFVRDITDRKERERLAYYDSLTQLPNRRLLLERLRQAVLVSAHSRCHGAVLFLDLDDFKRLNDTLGHELGDALLQQVSQRIGTSVRQADTVSRYGGDEFVVLVEGLSESAPEAARQASDIAEKMLMQLNQPYDIGQGAHHSTSSIGIALFSQHATSVEEILRQADIAMYQAKRAGRNTVRFYDGGARVLG